MQLTLKVRSYCSQSPTEPQARTFDSFPIIIGRSTACNYILNDDSRYISSNHAVILSQNGKLLIQDTSANGVYLNGDSEPIGRGISVALNHEDTLAIGDYTLTATLQSPVQSNMAGGVDDPFSNFASSSKGLSTASTPPSYDPFKGDEPDWTPASANIDDPFADGWDSIEKPASAEERPTVSRDSDWSDWPTEGPEASNSNTASTRHNTRAQDAFSPSNDDSGWPSTSSTNQPLPTSTHRTTNHSDASKDALDILLRAASLRESDFDKRDSTEVLDQTGKLLAQMTDAMMVLLQSRMELKNAIRTDVTTLSHSGNNPLKFSMSSADALTKLLANNADGYLQSDRAIQEAVEDLKLHQLAMLEGMKSAVKSLLLQFDPDTLANTLVKTGGISANIPIKREAKLWELFCKQYDTICEEAVNDFGDLFGQEFRRSYDKSISKLGRRSDF